MCILSLPLSPPTSLYVCVSALRLFRSFVHTILLCKQKFIAICQLDIKEFKMRFVVIQYFASVNMIAQSQTPLFELYSFCIGTATKTSKKNI